jgi:alpha-galactosidase
MGRPVKIAVIGAGSAVFPVGLVKDVCLTPNLASSLIAFMDVDQDRLDMIHLLALPFNREMDAHYR